MSSSSTAAIATTTLSMLRWATSQELPMVCQTLLPPPPVSSTSPSLTPLELPYGRDPTPSPASSQTETTSPPSSASHLLPPATKVSAKTTRATSHATTTTPPVPILLHRFRGVDLSRMLHLQPHTPIHRPRLHDICTVHRIRLPRKYEQT